MTSIPGNDANMGVRQSVRGSGDPDHYSVRQLSTVELERTRRGLVANLGLIYPGSPAHVPIQSHMRAIDAELADREGSREAGGMQS